MKDTNVFEPETTQSSGVAAGVPSDKASSTELYELEAASAYVPFADLPVLDRLRTAD